MTRPAYALIALKTHNQSGNTCQADLAHVTRACGRPLVIGKRANGATGSEKAAVALAGATQH
jgi:hypothetical protein